MPDSPTLDILERARYSPFLWTVANVALPNADWDFSERPWQKVILEDPHPQIDVMKSAQVGLTTISICKALWFMDSRKVNVIWTFPRQDDVSRFVQTRFQPMLAGSPNLEAKVGREASDPRSQRVTRFGHSYIYFQEASVEPRETPADMVVNDEVDRSNPEFLDAFRARMSNSKYKYHYRFSTPTLPGMGIDAIIERETDARYWMVKCPHCGVQQTLRWDTTLQLDADSQPYYGCEKCHGVLPPSAILAGQYVAMYPSRAAHGYHVSCLMMPLKYPAAYMYSLSRTMQLKNFYNLYLGETYESGGGSLSLDELVHYTYPESAPVYPMSKVEGGGNVYMGVDQKNEIHVLVGQVVEEHGERVIRVIYGEVIPRREGRDSWDRLALLMRRFNVRFCVHDAMPNQHNAIRFAEDFPGRVALKYDPPPMSELFRYDDRESKLLLDRTQNFDGLRDDISQGLWRFWGVRAPLHPLVQDVFTQYAHIKRDEVERRRADGSVVIQGMWKKTGPDDFGHAWAYLRAAVLVHPDNPVQVKLIGDVGEAADAPPPVEKKPSRVWDNYQKPKKNTNTFGIG